LRAQGDYPTPGRAGFHKHAENVVYMDLYNDISFEIAGKLVVLIEHQSTINP